MLTRLQTLWIAMLVMVFPMVALASWVGVPTLSRGDLGLLTIQSTPGGGGGGGGVGAPATRPAGGATAVRKEAFATVKAKADKVMQPLDAVVLWQKFIDSDPSADDLAKAQEEMKIWQERVDDDAVIISKKWVGGADKKRIESQVEGLIGEYQKLMAADQTLEAINKLREAAKVWPENYQIQFFLGSYAFNKGDYKEAIRYMEACNRIDDGNVAVLNNLGAALVLEKQFERGIQTLYRSVQMQDAKQNVQNLLTAFAAAPQGLSRATRLKAARDAVNLLAPKHGISGPANTFYLMSPQQQKAAPEADKPKEGGVAGNGSGFLITADGLILTNKHVAGAGKGVMVKFNDGTQITGEVVVVDDEQDLALVRVKGEHPFSYVKLAKYDNPADGATCIIMGYPLTNMVGFSVKVTSGQVASGNNAGMTSDVTLDARVNPGNSGGPTYDEYGNVMAIIAQKTLNLDGRSMDTYGLAISNGRIRRFLAKNNITVEPAEQEGSPLTVQQIAERNRMATVCILIVN
jgi:S1-C subfamily serine protease